MLETWWGRSLVASRASRAAYATLKCVCFCCLGLLLPLRHLPGGQSNAWLGAFAGHSLLIAAQALTVTTVLFCLVRAIPVIWEGRRYLAAAEKAPSRMAAGVTR